MHFKQCIFLFLFISLITNSYATTYYRHIPFTLKMTASDKLVVDYDFTQKKGIQCFTTHQHVKIDFVYKGHQKSTYLPVILESDHIPSANDHNELADVAGQFSLYSDQQLLNAQQYELICNYV